MSTHDPTATPRLINLREAAERTGLGVALLRYAIKTGNLPALDVSTGQRRHYRIRPDDLAAFIGGRQ